MTEHSSLETEDTLYINNINDKVSLNKLKPVLSKLFGRYGEVIQITAHRNLKMKGQAFVTYSDRKGSERALRKLQGRPVFKKPIRISYARSSSDEYLKVKGDLETIEKRKKLKKEREEAKKIEIEKKLEASPAPNLNKSQIKLWKALPPNNVLLLQNLKDEYLESKVLETTLTKFAGFERARLIKFRKLAFLDFELESNATECLKSIDLSVFGEEALLTYAKK